MHWQPWLARLDPCTPHSAGRAATPGATDKAAAGQVVQLWKKDLAKINPKAAEALADPAQYSNLFPDLQLAVQAEQHQARHLVHSGPCCGSVWLPGVAAWAMPGLACQLQHRVARGAAVLAWELQSSRAPWWAMSDSLVRLCSCSSWQSPGRPAATLRWRAAAGRTCLHRCRPWAWAVLLLLRPTGTTRAMSWPTAARHKLVSI